MSLHDLVAVLAIAVAEGSAAPGLLWASLSCLGVLGVILKVLTEESRRRTLEALLAAAKPGTLLCDRRGRRHEVMVVHLPCGPAVAHRDSPDRSG